MRISTEFLPRGENAAIEEAVSVARIRISVGQQNATDMRLGRQNALNDHIIAPAYPLAEGMSYRWWTLIYGRGRTTALRSMRAGFALPNIFIKPVGNNTIEVHCEPFVYDNPAISFVTKATELVATKTFENNMSQFLDAVVNRLRDEKIADTPLSIRRSAITESTADPEQYEFCKAAGAFGIDPYTCTDEIASFIENATATFEGDDLEEFLAGVTAETGKNAIAWLQDAEQHPDDWFTLPAIENCRREIRYRKTSGAPWTAGYDSARKARDVLHYGESEPVGTFTALAARLGNARFRATEGSSTSLRGVSRLRPGKPQAIVSGNRHPASLLFAMVRTFGDAIHFGSAHHSPVTDRIGTYRQQLGRAFAAEFLAPIDAIKDMRSRGEAIEDIADHFGVSDRVIGHQIENRDVSWLA
ncbi:MAG TPA: hypothetical protein VN802_22985 [Stellaceae bacterium]|nr:hypothetical protein [Stellaceae bacterium]